MHLGDEPDDNKPADEPEVGESEVDKKIVRLADVREILRTARLSEEGKRFLTHFVEIEEPHQSLSDVITALAESLRHAMPLAVANPATSKKAEELAGKIAGNVESCQEILSSDRRRDVSTLEQWQDFGDHLEEISEALFAILKSSHAQTSSEDNSRGNVVSLRAYAAQQQAPPALQAVLGDVDKYIKEIKRQGKIIQRSFDMIHSLASGGVGDLIGELPPTDENMSVFKKIGDNILVAEEALRTQSAALGPFIIRLDRCEEYLRSAAIAYSAMFEKTLK